MSWQGRQQDNMPTQKKKSTITHTHTHLQVHNQNRTHTYVHKHTAAVMRVYCDRHGDKTTFCVLSCETPQEYSWQEAETQAPWGSLAFVSHTFPLLFLFCNGERKFAKAKDFSPLIISAIARDGRLCKFTDFFFLLSDFLKCSSF